MRKLEGRVWALLRRERLIGEQKARASVVEGRRPEGTREAAKEAVSNEAGGNERAGWQAVGVKSAKELQSAIALS